MVYSIIIAVAGLLLSAITFMAGRQAAAKTDGKESGAIMSELGYLKSNTDDIKRRLDEQDKRHVDTVSRLVAVEASTKQAHKRIDRLEHTAGED